MWGGTYLSGRIIPLKSIDAGDVEFRSFEIFYEVQTCITQRKFIQVETHYPMVS